MSPTPPTKYKFSREPAVWIGTVATIVAAIVLGLAGLGVFTFEVAAMIDTLIPVVAAAITRMFVTPDEGAK